jgi:hypothetical protein
MQEVQGALGDMVKNLSIGSAGLDRIRNRGVMRMQMDVPRFDLGRLRYHAIRFAPLRLSTDWAWHSLRQIAPQVLQQRRARSGIFD